MARNLIGTGADQVSVNGMLGELAFQTKENVNSIIGLNEYDCGTVKYRPIEFKVFSGNKGKGKVVEEQKTPDSPFESIESGSWPAGVYNIACRSK